MQKMIFIKTFDTHYYLFSVLLFYIGRFLLNVIYIKNYFAEMLQKSNFFHMFHTNVI